MLPETPDVAHLSNVIAQSTGPAFVLGAVAGFLSILMTRMERVAERLRGLGAGGSIPADADLKRMPPPRVELLYNAIYFAVLAALATAALLLLGFVCAFLSVQHEHGMAVLFSAALVFLMISLVHFVREVRMAMKTMHLE